MFNDQNRQLFSANYLVFNGLLWSDPNREAGAPNGILERNVVFVVFAVPPLVASIAGRTEVLTSVTLDLVICIRLQN
jgi:hypothetical protein